MSVILSSADLEALTRAVKLLASPLDHEDVDVWRQAVNREVAALIDADSAGFLLPVPGGVPVFSEEHDLEAIAGFPEIMPPPAPDGTPIFARGIELGVFNLELVYEGDVESFLSSPYHKEYSEPNRANDLLSAMVSVGGASGSGFAALNFWHDSQTGRPFGDREIALLRLLFPAFRVGVENYMRWRQHCGNLLQMLDGLGEAALVADHTGRVVHSTREMETLAATEPEMDLLRGALEKTIAELCRAATTEIDSQLDVEGPMMGEVSTESARYRIRGCLYGAVAGFDRAYVVVSVERLTATPRSEQELKEAYSLTDAEIRVACLLGLGRSNAEIANELFVSPHTARRHTERILQKLGVRSRAEVASKLYF